LTRTEPPAAPGSVFFLSDYGLADEFVGVVHAVLHRLAPGVAVVDLTHQIPPYDVRGGAAALARALPYLGPGVVLAVVDPGVGGPRRGLAVEVACAPSRTGRGFGGSSGFVGSSGFGGSRGPGGSRWLVGPDNGLLLPAADQAGGIRRAVVLDRDAVDQAAALSPIGAATFDGRDLFGPAAALVCAGFDPTELGDPVAVADLLRVADPVVELGTLDDGRRLVRAEVTWVDRFGNAQLGAVGSAVPASVPVVTVCVVDAGSRPVDVRRVHTFSDLAAGEPGVLSDGNGRLALAVREGSASAWFKVAAGDLVELVW